VATKKELDENKRMPAHSIKPQTGKRCGKLPTGGKTEVVKQKRQTPAGSMQHFYCATRRGK